MCFYTYKHVCACVLLVLYVSVCVFVCVCVRDLETSSVRACDFLFYLLIYLSSSTQNFLRL